MRWLITGQVSERLAHVASAQRGVAPVQLRIRLLQDGHPHLVGENAPPEDWLQRVGLVGRGRGGALV